MRAEIVAVGTELLLGQVIDTNSAMIAAKLTEIGVDCYYQSRVGDNHGRIVSVLRAALARCDAVIVCGGLGPTQDDITREAIAEVMGVDLVLDETVLAKVRSFFDRLGRQMPKNNERQALVPKGATVIEQQRGTAPGLICSLGHKVLYAMPGVPYELEDMLDRAVLPDLLRRSGSSTKIQSLVVRTWGLSESKLAETLAPEIERLDSEEGLTLAFLASGMEGLKVRATAKGQSDAEVNEMLVDERGRLEKILGDYIFGYDSETMESVVGDLLLAKGKTLSVAESLTGGMVSSKIVANPGASAYFRGGVVSYATEVKQTVLGARDLPVISSEMASEMAMGVKRVLQSDLGLSLTGVAGPETQEGNDPGTVWIGIGDGETSYTRLTLFGGDRERIRWYATMTALDLLRLYLKESPRFHA
ncbi:nicotinamide-nucleotide amidase [Ferrithrix thermotolerans DSM 19514]|uniref:CinA-like protein n=1 Tax=Ferrithrix thermotolerans DSM 19514 TaxID=1121881 RepID=A0A1M4TQ43_9ACTN|nr:competence/damage-inducible protein A [Ferrithrix thermotolerans]SHE46548.1 nicotinamide-nucleotide amidase [Ferrithrix thermotolerans DSM 19514]